jgi:hypothetical protein
LVYGDEVDGEMARVTLIGQVRPFDPEMALVERYLRYQPAAERFLQLGDFRFHRLEPLQVRVIGGFGQAAWLEGERLTGAAALTLEQEREALAALAAALAPGEQLVGVDCFGVDLRRDGRLVRVAFPAASTAEAIVAVAKRALAEPR